MSITGNHSNNFYNIVNTTCGIINNEGHQAITPDTPSSTCS